MRVLQITVLLLASTFIVHAQKSDALAYKDPADVKVGDIIILNEPSDPNYYRSVYFTFKAAKRVYPEVNAEKYEKVYLSYKFKSTPFKVSKIRKGKAILAYGIMEDFAVLDLELGIRSGEVGGAENVTPIWLLNEIQAGDSIILKPIQSDYYQSITFAPEVAEELPDSLKSGSLQMSSAMAGASYVVNDLDKGNATLGYDSIYFYATLKLREGIESNEVDVVRKFSSVWKTESSYDIAKDTLRTPSLFTRLGITAYLFPSIEVAGTENSSSYSYGGGFGIIYKDKLQVGGYVQRYDGDFSKRLIFPNAFRLDYSYAGIFVAHQVYSMGPLRFLVEGKFGSGEAAWSLTETREVLDTDKFWVFNPRVGVDYKFSRFSMLNVSVGYRLASGLDLVDFKKKGLNSLTLSASLKLGWFN